MGAILRAAIGGRLPLSRLGCASSLLVCSKYGSFARAKIGLPTTVHSTKNQNFCRMSDLQKRHVTVCSKNPGGGVVHKTQKMAWLILGLLLAAPFALMASEKAKGIAQEHPVTLSASQGLDWVRECVGKYPEIEWLADANVRKTEEALASLEGTYSEQLFGQKFIEFDRTIMSLHCLRLILDGSDHAYEEFTKAQPQKVRLSRESFEKLHFQGKMLVRSKYQGMSEWEMTQAMEAALVLGDVGKSEKARSLFAPYGAKAPDHDDFHEEVMEILKKHPELSPTFAALGPNAKKLLIKTANLAHFGHITHLEGGPSMFAKLKESGIAQEDPLALSFDLFVHTSDVAGALGHVNNRSSLVYTELAHRAMRAVIDACQVLKVGGKEEVDAYDDYLINRAEWLGLDPLNPMDRALTRMGAMLRLFTPEEGKLLRQAVSALDEKARAQIIHQVEEEEVGDLGWRTFTYMPAVLVNLVNNPEMGSSQEERILQAISLWAGFYPRVVERYKEMLDKGEIDLNAPLNFNKIAAAAKVDPYSLNGDFLIDKEGNVKVKGD